MRPDETCMTRGITGIPCKYHYYEGRKHRCKIFDKLRALRAGGVPPRGLILKQGENLVRLFFMRCLSVEEVTKPRRVGFQGGGCIRCGDCCKNLVTVTIRDGKEVPFFMREFVYAPFLDRTITTDPVTGKPISGQCKHLEYHPEFDNGVDDLGYRCAIWETAPEECKNFPTGKEANIFEEWLEGGELRLTRLPRCPARFREAR